MSIFLFPSRLKYRIFREPVDFRNGKNGLSKMVFRHLGKGIKDEPIMFLFYNKSRKEIKGLLYDDPLFTLLQCGLISETTFHIPYINPSLKTLDVDAGKMMKLLNGFKIDPKQDSGDEESASC